MKILILLFLLSTHYAFSADINPNNDLLYLMNNIPYQNEAIEVEKIAKFKRERVPSDRKDIDIEAMYFDDISTRLAAPAKSVKKQRER